tara:strand:- start:29 stop:322 length:294 start_codon:yes stop_codon:yes gene_type:complete
MVSGGTMNLVNGIWANIIKRKNKKEENMYINKAVVNSYDYPYNKGKQSKTLELENTLKVDRGVMIKKLLPLIEEFEDTLETYNTEIELIINIKPSKD